MPQKHKNFGLLYLLVVYLVWGSTFMAIRYSVQGEGSFAPFILASLRVGLAGIILLIYAALTKENLLLPKEQWIRLALTGFFLWFGGHALVMWTSQWADSGYSALLFASIPLWTALIEGYWKRGPHHWAQSLKIAPPLFAGFLGILVLTAPVILATHPDPKAGVATGILLFSAFSWALGSALFPSSYQKIPTSVCAGYQQIFGALFCVIASYLNGEHWQTPRPGAIWALAYLTLIGSVLAFTSYVKAKQLLPNNLVASFAYVNPIIAVTLGSIFLGEKISSFTLAGMILVITSVVWLFRTYRKMGVET